jgi:hypothetical protein
MPSEQLFIADSPLEGDGFELPVPREKKSRYPHQVAFRGANSPDLPNNNVSPEHPRDRGDVRIRYEETGSGFPLLGDPGRRVELVNMHRGRRSNIPPCR